MNHDIFWESEIHANKMTALVMFLSFWCLVATVLLNEVGVFNIARDSLYPLTLGCSFCLLIPWGLCIYYHGERPWLKYLLLIALTLSYAATDFLLTYRVIMIMAIPVILSSRYYSRKLTINVAILTIIVFGLSASASIVHSPVDLNYVNLPANTVLNVPHNDLADVVQALGLDMSLQKSIILMRSFFPKCFPYILIAVASVQVASRGRSMVIQQAEISREHSRVETELNLARTIQERVLPIVKTFNHYPEFDLAASMVPAKEVGGDFYDFFFLDETHLALAIADVSGKGIPAALFMMISKIYLDNSLKNLASPGKVLEEVNHRLAEKNLENMFVSVWLGVLDLKTGKILSANAGHEYPLICHKGHSFELIKDKHGLVLGGMDGMRYPETEFQLKPGDILFVYTDGIPDSINSNQQSYGLDQAIVALNQTSPSSMEEMITELKDNIHQFSGDEPQFDDTTMLALQFKCYKE